MNNNISFIIPNRGGTMINFIVEKLRKFYPGSEFIVISQDDDYAFMRGQLFNIGYKYASNEYLCLIDNDVFFPEYIDLIGIYNTCNHKILQPFTYIHRGEVVNGEYVSKRKILMNVYRSELDKRVNPKEGIAAGGTNFLTKEVFKSINGFSNLYLGWGREDNEFFLRSGRSYYCPEELSIAHIDHPTRQQEHFHTPKNWNAFAKREKRNSLLDGLKQTIFTVTKDYFENEIHYINVTNIYVSDDCPYKSTIDVHYKKQELEKIKNELLKNSFNTSNIENTIKTAVCCIAKQENHYIREFVEHYKSLGFNNIILYDNNDPDGETFDEVIKDYIDSGYVILKDARGLKGTIQWRKSYTSILIDKYNECYKEYSDKFDWILFVDIDEFLILNENNSILEFLLEPKFKDFNCIKFIWKYYDDNGLVSVKDGNYSVKRFKNPSTIKSVKNSPLSKAIVKTKLGAEINSAHGFQYVNKYHNINKDIVKACNATGQRQTNLDCPVSGTNKDKCAWINHYRFKTIEEFIDKMKRAWPDNFLNGGKHFLTLNLFFSCNTKTKEKEDLANLLLNKNNVKLNISNNTVKKEVSKPEYIREENKKVPPRTSIQQSSYYLKVKERLEQKKKELEERKKLIQLNKEQLVNNVEFKHMPALLKARSIFRKND